jgi:hypothetical protein
MPVTFVRDPVTGITYSANIAGDTPTEQETARINEFLDARRPPPPAPPPPPEEVEPDTSYLSAFASGIDQPLENLATTARLFGMEGLAGGLSGATQAPENYQSAIEGLINEDGRFYDLSYLPRAAVEQSGQLLGSLATRGAGALVGGGAGSLLGPGGAAAGAVAGAYAGPALFEGLQVLGPVAYERARNNGREEPNTEDFLGALATAGVSGVLNAIAPNLDITIGRLLVEAGTEGLQSIAQQAGETLLTESGLDVNLREAGAEALVGGVAIGAIDVPVVASRAVSERRGRPQKELEDDIARAAEEARKDAERAAAQPSPTEFGEGPQSDVDDLSAIALPAPEAADQAAPVEADWKKSFRRYERERMRDIKPVSLRDLPIQEVRAIRAARQAQGITNQTQLGRNATLQEIQAVLGTDAVTREVQKQKPMSAAETAFAPIENKSFSQQQFDAVLDTVRATGKINFPEVKKVLQKTQRDPVPTSMVNDVLTEASNRGLFERTAKPRKDGGTRFSYQLSPALTAAQTEGSINQKQLSDIQREFAEKQQEIARLQEEARRIEQTGKTLAGKPRKISTPERKQIARLEADNRNIAARMQDISARMGLEPAIRPVPAVELTPAAQRREQTETLQAELADQRNRANEAAKGYDLQITALKRRLSDAQKAVARGDETQRSALEAVRGQISDLQTQRELARSAVLRGEAPTPAPTLRYTPRFQSIVNNLRGRLDRIGLKDVGLRLESLLDQDAMIEGVYSPENRVIKLASALHDSNLSDAQLEARLSEIMDHELVHALWEMGLFTDAERASLIKAAGERQYVAMIDGKPTKRKYTYLQRAQRMYADQDLEIQQEEAIAEMFRNYASGRDQFSGRPQNIFKRIINFFKSFSKAATQEGAQGPADIFAGIERGEIGARERTAVPGATERYSRRVSVPDESPVFGTSGVPLFDDPIAIPGKVTIRKIGEAFTEYNNRINGRQLFPEDSDFDYNAVLETATEELAEQMKQPNSGAGWYSRDVQLAVDLTSQVYPRISDPEGRSLYLTLAGIFSSGLEPEQAWLISGEAFDAWQRTGEIPVTREDAARMLGKPVLMTTFKDKSGQTITRPAGWTPRNQANVQQIQMFKNLVEREGGLVEAVNWLSSPQPREAINQLMLDSGFAEGRYKTKAEREGQPEFGALVFGEKLGRYTIGLHGVEITADDTTVDLWYTRSYRRWTGRLLEGPVDPKTGIAGQVSPARGGIERQTIFRLTNDLSQRFNGMPPGDVQAMLWFFEKRLWGAQGLRTNEGTNSAGAKQLLASRGISADDGIASAAQSEPIGKEPSAATRAAEERLSRRAQVGSEGISTGAGRIGPGTAPATRESRRPTQRPAAEDRDTDIEPVTGEDLGNINEDFLRRPGWAIVTATREDLDPQFKDRINKQENDILRYHLEVQGIPFVEVSGTYQGEDQGVSFLIVAPESTAMKLGNQAGQESILTNKGLVYTFRPLPPTVATGTITTGREARGQEFFSETRDGFAFSMGLDFSTGPGKLAFPEGTYERTDRPQLPIRKSDNMVELFHWSDKNLTNVDPAFAGTGPLLGAERRRGARLGFFGINPRKDQRDPGTGYVKEGGLGSILHRALVDPDRLYPWTSDPAGFKENLTSRTQGDQISEAEQRIRDAGYLGYYAEDDGNVRDPSAPLGNVASLFEAIPVEPVRQERESRRPMYSVTAAINATSGTSNMTAIQNQVTQYTDIADWFGKALGLVVRRPGRAQEIADKFIQKAQDSFIPVARMIKELKERGLTIRDVVDPYLQQQLSRSRAGAQIDDRKRGIYRAMADAVKRLDVSTNMRDGLIRVSRSNATKGDGLAKYIFDRTDSDKQAVAEIYLYAKHALERNQYVRQVDAANQAGSGMTDAEANAIINWFNSSLSQQNRSAIAQVEAAAKAIVADTNKVRIDGNLIAPSVMNVKYNKKGVLPPDFQNYVPLRGVFDDDATADYSGTFAGTGYNVRGREDRRILGRDAGEYGSDILANLLFQNSNSIIRAEQNQVSLALADLLQSNPQLTKSFGQVVARAPQMRILNPAGNVQYTTDPKYKDRNDIIIAKRNGEEVIIQMEDENLAGAFNGKNVWNAGHANAILRGLSKLNRYLSNIVTSWNPEFVFTNFFRDIQGAGINISEFDLPGLRRDVVKNIPSALAGLRAAIRDENFSSPWSQRYREFALAGGQSAANPMNTLQDQVDQISNILNDFGKGGSLAQLRKSGGKIFKFLEDYNTVVENAVRLTTYDALIKRGFSSQRAAQAARSVTVDFTKTGDMGQFMNSLYLFYNAALQGSFFMFRAAARSRKVRRVLAGAIAMGIVMDMINSMVSGEDEAGIDEYDKLSDYLLEHNWVIMLPPGMGPDGRNYIPIPMPYGLNFFYNTGRAISRTGRGGYDVGQGSASIARTLVEVINPLGGIETFANAAAPTFADPFINVLGNINFAGRDIVREPFPNQRVASSHLYWNNTSPTAVAVAQSLNALSGGTPTLGGWADVSPNLLEFWFDYVTGGAGQFVQRTAELPLRIADPEQTSEDIIREVPIIRRFFGSVSSREDMGTYIRNRDRVLDARAEFRDAMKAGDRERAMAARERFPEELRIAEAVNSIENQRREITRRINEVRANPRMPEERKQEIIQRLTEQQQRVILRGLQLMIGQD